MNNVPKVSIIIRTKNEERWIVSCLKSVFNQDYKNFEVILVDNQSTDKTVEKAKMFDVQVVTIEKFLPGKAINLGIEQALGDFLVCLSGHCIPVNPTWLSTLIDNFDDPKVAGVYGRQEPMSFSGDFDKRDLLIVFGLDKKIQKKDPFFHNANSAIRRDVWEQIPFDHNATNIEDRIWAKEVLSKEYHLIYEPEASVYHYHGIHQDMDQQRCNNIVRILESMAPQDSSMNNNTLDADALNVVALIPVMGEPQYLGKKALLEYTIEHAQQSRLINKIIISTDNSTTADLAKKAGAEVPFTRPSLAN